jgi:hypothetical protein
MEQVKTISNHYTFKFFWALTVPFFILKNEYIYKKALGNAHPALCSTVL